MTFGTTEPRDVKYLRDYVGEAADHLATLKRYHALDWTEAGAVPKKSPFA